MRRVYESDEEEEDTQQLTQFSQHTSDPEGDNMWEVVRILQETKNKYLVEWAGLNPETNTPWKPTWVFKEDCSDELIREWKKEKLRKKEAKKKGTTKKKTAVQPPQSTASSKNSMASGATEHSYSLRNSQMASSDASPAHPSTFEPRSHPKPVVEIIRKRPRPPSNKSGSEEKPDMSSGDGDPLEMARARKRRRMASSSPPKRPTEQSTYSDSDSTPDLPVRSTLSSSPVREKLPLAPAKAVDRSQQNHSDLTVVQEYEKRYGDSSQLTTGGSFPLLPERKSQPAMRPIPGMSPRIFRERLDHPLSQIEEWSSPPTPSQAPGDTADPAARHNAQSGRRTSVASSNISQLIQATSHSSGHTRQPGPGSYDEEIGVSNFFDELPFAKDNLLLSTDREAGEGTQSQYSQTRRPVSPIDIPKSLAHQPSTRSLLSYKQTESPTSSTAEKTTRNLQIIAGNAAIKALETRVQMLEEDLQRRQKRLDTEIEEHEVTKDRLKEQVSSLTTALKQFASLSVEGIDSILKPKERTPVTDLAPAITAPVVPPYSRSTEDDELISRLRQENAMLQDQVSALHAAQSRANDLVEQARDLARKAEVTKMELTHQVRRYKDLAENAPKNAEELYSAQLTAARDEIQSYKAQLDILTTQNTLTDDNVRKKAAKYDVLARKYQNLKAQSDKMFEEFAQMEDTKDSAIMILQGMRDILMEVNASCPDDPTLAKLRPLVGGLDQSREQQEEEIFGEEDEEETSEQSDDSDVEVHQPVEDYDEFPRAEEGGPTIVVEEMIDISRPSLQPSSVETSQSRDSDAPAFACLWHTGQHCCQENRSSREALTSHIFDDHVDAL